MQAYDIQYHLKGKPAKKYDALVDAKDSKSAKNKIAKKHGCKKLSTIIFDRCRIIGYY